MKKAFLAAVLAVTVISGYNILDEVKTPAQAQTVTYEVQEGDTLWNIAGKHSGNDTDIRRVIYTIEQDNQIKNGALTPGQKIVLRK